MSHGCLSQSVFREVLSMSIDWMHSLIVVSFVAMWALIGQFGIARP